MKFWPLTVHLEIEFDSYTWEPSPWWRPFWWIRGPWTRPDDCEDPTLYEPLNGLISRCGIFGLHFCIAIHWYGDAVKCEVLPP